MSRKEDMIPFEAKFIFQTEGAIKVDIDGEIVWLPKEAIEYDEDQLEDASPGNTIEISIPERMATDKQLI